MKGQWHPFYQSDFGQASHFCNRFHFNSI
jgi:hypothetical protein